MLLNVEPILAVRDVEASIRFYRDVLGFESDWTWGEDKQFGGVKWGRVHILLQGSADGPFGMNLFLSVRDVDTLYEKHLMAGVVESPMEDKPWGRREYVVVDPDGHRLRLAGRVPSQREASKELPDAVRFEPRVANLEEFNQLRRSVGWRANHSKELLEKTWGGFVALNQDEVIGTVRITMDSEGWFGIWDVIVKPDWQGRRIGENLMNRAVEFIKASSPGAIIFLFTFQNEFYEKLGFSPMEAMRRDIG